MKQKALYCKNCKKTTRHLRLSMTDMIGDSFMGRLTGTVFEFCGAADIARFCGNFYHYKCTNCGRITERKADGTENFGYGEDKL